MIGDMDERSFFQTANDHTYGYQDPGEVADNLMWDALECEFKDDISKLLESGRDAEITGYVEVIIQVEVGMFNVIMACANSDGHSGSYKPVSIGSMETLTRIRD